MSLDVSTPLAVADPRAYITRHFQGHYTTVHVDGCAPLRVTQNHPVLTHAGWAPARALVGGVRVVVLDGPDHLPVGSLVDDAHAELGSRAVATSRRDFYGDAGTDPPQVSPPDAALAALAGAMLVGEEGETPALDPWLLLAAMTSPQAFGAGTWDAACRAVPGLSAAWPSGPPVAHTAGLDVAARVRLGAAADALPEPPVDLTGWAAATTGLAGTLRFARVTRVTSTLGGGQVCDVVSGSGCVVAGGIVVA